MQLRGNLRLKFFREGSDYEFGNDYAQSNIHLKLGKQVAERWYVLSKSRAEMIKFDERTQFDYDYHYFDTGLGVETGSYFGRYLRVFSSLGLREAPETTELSFNRILYSTGRLTWTGMSGRTVTLRAESEILNYDTQTRTWFNNHFLRGSLRVRLPVTGISFFYIEPRAAKMRCESFIEERYTEASVVLGFDVMGSERYWLTCSWEPVRARRLPTAVGDEEPSCHHHFGK